MKFFTYKKVAAAHKAFWQKIRFTRGKGYWLFGKPPVHVGPITMYDSVTISEIPKSAAAVAGYVNGYWPTFAKLADAFPHAHRLSIAVNATADADCLDVEQGDAIPSQAPAWVKRQKARGIKKPVIYTSVSQANTVLRELSKAGIGRDEIRLWTAHYTFKPHRCTSKCGFGFTGVADATQWTNNSLGRNLDASICAGSFFKEV